MQSANRSEDNFAAGVMTHSSSIRAASFAPQGIYRGCDESFNLRFVATDFPIEGFTVLSVDTFTARNADEVERIAAQSKRWMVTYPYLNLLVIGEDPIDFATHDNIKVGTQISLQAAQNSPDLANFAQRYPRDIYSEPVVDGFRYGKNFVIRIEDHSERLNDREFLNAKLDMYRRAYKLIRSATVVSGGEVHFLLMGKDPETRATIAKILGVMDKVVDQDEKFPGPRYIEEMRQVTRAGSVFYSEPQRIRFILPHSLRELAADEILDDRQRAIEAIDQYDKWLNPPPGKRFEARMLLLDAESEKPLNQATESAFRTWFSDIAYTAKDESVVWERQKDVVRGQILSLADHQARLLPACLNSDNPLNSEFARIMGTILRSVEGNREISRDFSTPLKPIEFGHFETYPDGTKKFVHISGADPIPQLVTAWVFKKFPNMNDRDWLCLFEPVISLTFDRHSPQFVRLFKDLHEKNYVVTFGDVGEPEQRWVIKENVYAVKKLGLRDTPRMKKLLSFLPGQELSNGIELNQHAQHDIARTVHRASGASYSRIADDFVRINREDLSDVSDWMLDRCEYQDGDLLYRPFYPGPRVDLMRLTEKSFRQLAGLLRSTAELAALNFIIQGPSFDFSNLVIDKMSAGDTPEEAVLLGTADTLSNSLRAKNLAMHMILSKTIHANHAAAIVQCFRHGMHAESMSEDQIARREDALIKIFINTFRDRLLEITGPGRARCEESLDYWQENIQSWIKANSRETGDLEDFDRTKGFAMTRELLNLSSAKVSQYCKDLDELIRAEGADIARMFSQRSEDDPDIRNPNYKLRNDLIMTVNGLVNNHIPEYDDYLIIERILTGKLFSLREFSIEEKKYLFDFIDFAVWANEVELPRPLCKKLLDGAENAIEQDDFLKQVQEELVGYNPPGQLLTNFYCSVRGLHKLSDPDHEEDVRRDIIGQMIDTTQGILGPIAKMGDVFHLKSNNAKPGKL